MAVFVLSNHSLAFSNNEAALAEYEDGLALFMEYLNTNYLHKTKQTDIQAKPVLNSQDGGNDERYESAIYDDFYGYQLFMLVDKSVSKVATKERDGSVRQAQSLYLYKRDGDSLQLQLVLPVSTGAEPLPRSKDTREGFTRIQSADEKYTSKTYGEAMPFSLWFETEYGTAIHKTTQARCDQKIGRRASAGCIRVCPSDAEPLFRRVTEFSANTPVVLLNKRTGIPIHYGQFKVDVQKSDGKVVQPPMVVEGYPVFVRIIDGNTEQKINEIQSIIDNPTEGFRRYFPKVDQDALRALKSI